MFCIKFPLKEGKESYSYIHLEPTYPHKLLMCMKEIRDSKAVPLNSRKEYLKVFHELFPDCTDEWNLLKIAYEQNVILDFLEADEGPFWQKRVTIKKTFLKLLKTVSERDAAIRNLADLYRSIGEQKKAGKWYRMGTANGDE